jgi:ABC-type multidrug transport system permease subunit
MSTEGTQEKAAEQVAWRATRRRNRIQNHGRRMVPVPMRAGNQIPLDTKTPPQYRIGTMSKWLMLLISFLFDLLPLLAVMGIVVFVVSSLGVSINDLTEAHAACVPEITGVQDGVVRTGKCAYYGGKLLVFGGLSGMATLWFFGPLVYMLMSFLCAILAPLIFFAWFAIKKVPYFSLKGGRLQVILLSVLVKLCPFTSFLPSITFLTWRQIRISRKEDVEKVV